MSKNHLIQVLIISAILSAIFQVSAYGQQANSNFRTEKAVILGAHIGVSGIGGDICAEIGRIYKDKFNIGAGAGVGYNEMAVHGDPIKSFNLPLYLYAGYNHRLKDKLSAMTRFGCGYVIRSNNYKSYFFINPEIGLMFNRFKRSSKPFILVGYLYDYRNEGVAGVSLKFGIRF